MRKLKLILATVAGFYLMVVAYLAIEQRNIVFLPTHERSEVLAGGALRRWESGGEYLGYARIVDNATRAWLVLHGNAGQAAERAYVLDHVSPSESVYVLEYPGYGDRPGSPSMASHNAAAVAAYRLLAARHGRANMQVLGESLGSGPAAHLGSLEDAPPRIVLVVPFHRLVDVAKETYPFLPVGLLMRDPWDNEASLARYRGRLEIFGAARDQVIPPHHARSLAAALPVAVYTEIQTGHTWSRDPSLRF